jgi:hypothetical protein
MPPPGISFYQQLGSKGNSPVTARQRILYYLQKHPEGADDDELAVATGLSTRQQANIECRRLEQEGLVIRHHLEGKIHNFPTGNAGVITKPAPPPNVNRSQDALPKNEHWFWEGNVQSKVISYLAIQGYQIRSVADTASHQQGIDIIAERDGKQLWVSVKGYPQETDRTPSSMQAGHWFKEAVFDIVEYHERDKNVSLALALPDFPRYRNMANKITWLKPVANYTYYWVNESGQVADE